MDETERSSVELPLGYRGSVTLRLHPIIRLKPKHAAVVLRDSLKPALRLEGTCHNLEGKVACTLTWLVQHSGEEVREVADPRRLIEIDGASSHYSVLADGRALADVDVLKLNLLGTGKLGYRLRPDPLREPLEVLPKDSSIEFDYSIAYQTKSGATIGEPLRIDPIRVPSCMHGLPVKLTLFDSDTPTLGKPYEFVWNLGEPHPENGKDKLFWRFGCTTSRPPEGEAHELITLDYCEHLETDGVVEYGARLEVLDRPPDDKKKPEVLAALELPSQWVGSLPRVGGFALSLERAWLGRVGVGAQEARFEAEGTFAGFHSTVELRCELELWATKGAEVRPLEEVLREVQETQAQACLWRPEMSFEAPIGFQQVVATRDGAEHRFQVVALDIDTFLARVADVASAREHLKSWRVFGELRVSRQMTGGVERPMAQIATTGATAVGVDHGVLGRRFGAAGVASAMVSFEGVLSQHPALSERDWFDAYVLAMCIFTEARDNSDLGKRRVEMLHVGGCIANRARTKYGKCASLYEVVLAPKQFSHFNKDQTPEKQALLKAHAAGDKPQPIADWAATLSGSDKAGWDMALGVAEEIIRTPASNPLSDQLVRHYYSPRSMTPPGSKPDWADPAKRYPVTSISEDRFLFYRDVA